LPLITTKQISEVLGVSPARVSQVKKTGRLDGTFRKKGATTYYDQDSAIAAWNGEIPQLISRVSGSDQEIPSFNESRAKSEHFRAELARLDLEEKEEKLCEAEKVRREAFSLARSVRDAVNTIPDRVANQFAAETDPVVIHQALTEEMRKALERLTDG
jgi:phage terminase Nu1 subunit (DNA packaging protein)|tara:strand:- start:8148 stop:8621 length:474 start_codon:yes stop_codon:yes gene_type:complete